MDQARSTISKIFNGEPHTYTRFNLARNMEGDNSHVELKMSTDMVEEADGNGVGEHLNHNSNHKPYMAHKPGRDPKNICFKVAMGLLIFIIGYLISFMIHWKKDVGPNCASSAPSVPPYAKVVAPETGAAPLMDWDDVKALLAKKVSAAKFESVFSEFSSTQHRAGSPGDEALGNKMLDRFKEYGMKTWTDEHFVKVQDPPASGYNTYTFRNQTERLDGFLSYSGTGTRTGAALQANYGQEEDFKRLRDKGINMNGRVVLVKTGLISLAEKVANAAKMNVSAVLIYPDSPSAEKTPLFGHVHMGSGDPYTPGFPSFNHTQFPPIESSGLPKILAQTISNEKAKSILANLGGESVPDGWGSFYKLGGESDLITVEISNVLTEKKINNVFGVIKGFVDEDRYVVIGAQRDAWGPGFAASTVGTSVLVELARSISDMVKNDEFKPRRSIVFASWSAGEYGNVGATEWLEGYLTSLSMKAFAYINLDAVVTGDGGFKVSASPLLHSLIQSTMRELNYPNKASLFSQFGRSDWEKNVLQTMKMNDTAYPFLAFSGIPSVSFRFNSEASHYRYFGTLLDTREKLNIATVNKVTQLAELSARFAGHMALRLVHDHLLHFDLKKYDKVIRTHVAQINSRVLAVKRIQKDKLPRALTVQWLMSASGSYSRASDNLLSDIQNSNLDDIEMCRIINDRIMAVERNLLSPYLSPRENPFRHILLGSGPHTLKGLANHLDALRMDTPDADATLFRNQFALATWTLQGCANSLAGDIWSLDNEI
ncbi:transferrin receptor protein 1-like [Xyrichtys novacula]|uniref:Transferrin receptor protein 1 n=1 Tax=Xyrichtys novacula TaxID=13765 RepID=A0AAV1GE69_XYRNO|nr:transferrin receptor protein 1-like [Xyrichtys novacula]